MRKLTIIQAQAVCNSSQTLCSPFICTLDRCIWYFAVNFTERCLSLTLSWSNCQIAETSIYYLSFVVFNLPFSYIPLELCESQILIPQHRCFPVSHLLPFHPAQCKYLPFSIRIAHQYCLSLLVFHRLNVLVKTIVCQSVIIIIAVKQFLSDLD